MARKHRSKNPLQLTCAQCGKTFFRWPSHLTHNLPLSSICCSRSCKSKRVGFLRFRPNRERRAQKEASERAVAALPFTAPEFADEIWRSIPMWGAYEASTLGRIRRVRIGEGTRKYPHLLKPAQNKKGYLHVALHDNGRRRPASVHTLVMEAFIGPRPLDKDGVNHKDGNKANNCLANLEYCTNAENLAHAKENGLLTNTLVLARMWKFHPERMPRGERSKFAKLTDEKVREILRLLKEGQTPKTLGQRYGVSGHTISMIKLRKAWRHVT